MTQRHVLALHHLHVNAGGRTNNVASWCQSSFPLTKVQKSNCEKLASSCGDPKHEYVCQQGKWIDYFCAGACTKNNQTWFAYIHDQPAGHGTELPKRRRYAVHSIIECTWGDVCQQVIRHSNQHNCDFQLTAQTGRRPIRCLNPLTWWIGQTVPAITSAIYLRDLEHTVGCSRDMTTA